MRGLQKIDYANININTLMAMINKNKIILIVNMHPDEKYACIQSFGFHTGYFSYKGHNDETPWEETYHHFRLKEYYNGRSIWDMPDDTATAFEVFGFSDNMSREERIEKWQTFFRDREHWYLVDYSDFICECSLSKRTLCQYIEKIGNNEAIGGIYIADGNSQKDLSECATKIMEEFLMEHADYYADDRGVCEE